MKPRKAFYFHICVIRAWPNTPLVAGGAAPTLLQTLVAPLVLPAMFQTFVAWHSRKRPLSQALSRKACRKNRFLLQTLLSRRARPGPCYKPSVFGQEKQTRETLELQLHAVIMCYSKEAECLNTYSHSSTLASLPSENVYSRLDMFFSLH